MSGSDGGPAFPVECYFDPATGNPTEGLQTGNTSAWVKGMSLRDYFAAKALPAVIHNCLNDTRSPDETLREYFARKSYEVADAMLAAREEKLP